MTFRDPERGRAYVREWRRLNPAIVRVANANARAKKLGIEGRITSDEVRDVLREATCVYCGIHDDPGSPKTRRLTIDHIIPMSVGGPNTRENLQAACWLCNARKFNGSRLGWAVKYDACEACGTTDKRHSAHGLCTMCYARSRYVSVRGVA